MSVDAPDGCPLDEAQQAGFDLRNVTWGYQEIFRERIDALYRQGLLGENNPGVTQRFYEVLAHSDKSTFDSVLKSFLDAIGGENRWLLRLPRLFEHWCTLGLRITAARHFLGMKFFDACGRGELGRTPAELEFVMATVALLLDRQPGLISAFIDGYPVLARDLEADGIREFVFEAITLARRNPETAAKYLAAQLTSSRKAIEQRTRQARLAAMNTSLERLARALVGRDFGVESLSSLDSDDVFERGCLFAGCAVAAYLPAALNHFPQRTRNQALYKTFVLMATAAVNINSFAAIHGVAGTSTLTDLAQRRYPRRNPVPLAALTALIETVRIRNHVLQHYPGARAAVERLTALAAANLNSRRYADRLLALALKAEAHVGELHPKEQERSIAAKFANAAGEAESLNASLRFAASFLDAEPTLAHLSLPPPFLLVPDMFFPLQYSAARGNRAKVDQRQQSRRIREQDESSPEAKTGEQHATAPDDEQQNGGADDDQAENDGEPNRVEIGYFYPEWDVHSGDYFPDWCCVRECRIGQRRQTISLSADIQRYTDQVRSFFERLKPEESAVQSREQEGDNIRLDHFMEYIAERNATHNSEMRFYDKPLVNRRDVAVAILLDLSGSTAQEVDKTAAGGDERRVTASSGGHTGSGEEGKTVLQVEKEAAFVLASGLQSIGDRFGLFGFTGTSRQNCQFFLFKEFEEPWDQRRTNDLLGAFSGSSTRIGAALRHVGWKLDQVPGKTKLIALITDGKPCDQGYDPETRYAHHDVRKACEENRRMGLHTFCISTSENTPADMDLMFPRGRYIILDTIARLPTVLSRLYLQLTR